MPERLLPSVDELAKITLSAQSLVERALQSGRLFSGGSGLIVVPKGKHFAAILSNPKDSGRYVRVFRITAYSTITAFLDFVYEPTNGMPVKEVANRVRGSDVKPSALFKVGLLDVALKGRVLGDSTIALTAGKREVVDLVGLELLPGQAVGFSVSPPDKCDAVLTFVWAEEDQP